jgi:UDP-N-acetyl-D-glucosamine dehydrogenase
LRQEFQGALRTPLSLPRQHQNHIGGPRRVHNQKASSFRSKPYCRDDDESLCRKSLSRSTQEQDPAAPGAVGIIGLGYVGLPLALLFSEQKFAVTGFDIDQRKVDTSGQGESYIYRISAEEIRRPRRRAFPPPPTTRRSRDGRHHHLRPHPSQPISRTRPQLHHRYHARHRASSAGRPVGRSREYNLPRHHRRSDGADSRKRKQEGTEAARGVSSAEKEFFVAFSPEREDPGNTTVARRDIPKVVGGVNPQASELAGALYGSIFHRTVPVSSPAAAEMTKLLENIYRCVNIALVNELKMLCLRMGLDIWEVIEAASTKPFGFHPFYPGPGLGGHCIPVDPFYLILEGQGMGLPHPLHRTGGRDQHQHAVSRARLHRRSAEPA